jgi:hypothetical protein
MRGSLLEALRGPEMTCESTVRPFAQHYCLSP